MYSICFHLLVYVTFNEPPEASTMFHSPRIMSRWTLHGKLKHNKKWNVNITEHFLCCYKIILYTLNERKTTRNIVSGNVPWNEPTNVPGSCEISLLLNFGGSPVLSHDGFTRCVVMYNILRLPGTIQFTYPINHVVEKALWSWKQLAAAFRRDVCISCVGICKYMYIYQYRAPHSCSQSLHKRSAIVKTNDRLGTIEDNQLGLINN